MIKISRLISPGPDNSWLNLIAGVFLAVLVATTASAQRKSSAPDFLMKLETRADFDLLKGEPLSKNYHGIESVKLVYAIENQSLYYIHSGKYRWHYMFTSKVLGDDGDLAEFNKRNYAPEGRNYILATFNYNIATRNYFLQFAACDNPTDEHINLLVNKIEQTFFGKSKFKILLNSTILLRRKKSLETKHHTMLSNELYKNQAYQPVCEGKTSGLLLFIDADSIKPSADYSDCILILKGSTNDLPLCRGLITNEFQTPLSHICLLTTNRRTPCAAQKNIFEIDSLKQFKNYRVELTVGEKKAVIRKTISKGVNKTNPNPDGMELSWDSTERKIARLRQLSYKSKISFGSKAAQLAELSRVKYNGNIILTPQNAFAIPFYYYHRHMRACGAYQLTGQLSGLKGDSLIKGLEAVRRAIRSFPVDRVLLDSVNAECWRVFGKRKIRFRSSSNCEDEAFFNGAGLYASTTGIPGDSVKTLEKAITKVWASLWLLRAYREREFFGLSHNSSKMAVLVHEAFDNEDANGVALTKNVYRNYEFGYVINLQKGEEEVVSPRPGTICEQLITYMDNTSLNLYNASGAADWISFSSLQPGKSLLSETELKELSEQLYCIKQHFYKLYKKWPKLPLKDFGMDVEFKILQKPGGKRLILFKQARPFG